MMHKLLKHSSFLLGIVSVSLSACSSTEESKETQTEENTKAIVIENDDGSVDTLLVAPNQQEK